MQLRDILRSKGTDVVTIRPDAAVPDLVRLLGEHRIGAAVVSIDGHNVAGIVSERDVVRHLDAGWESRTVAEIMTADVRTAGPAENVHDLARTMTEHRIRHVPVVDDDGGLAGIVSIGDVVKSRIGELEFERNQLEGYIAGT